MDARFLLHNIHRQDPEHFQALDAHLCKLKQDHYLHVPALLSQLPRNEPGIYTLTGGALTGKTTLLKQWMAQLLADSVPAEAITFLSGELITDSDDLIHLLEIQLKNKLADITQYLICDDVTHLRDWDKAIKFANDTGLLTHAVILLSSSDKTISKKIPIKIDFQLHPLTFHESIVLKHHDTKLTESDLFKEFNDYLMHGGYLLAMNDMAMHGKILDETLNAYSTSLLKEILRHGKQEHFFREILTAIVEHYCRPITWNLLTQELSIDHPKTIGDYIALLEALDAVFVQAALLEEELKAAPKKARKLMFTDPFIFHAIRAWLHQPNNNAFESEIIPSLNDPILSSQLVKACATTQYRRYYPTYYIKAEGEIDLAYLYEQRFWPVVITWTNQLRTKDLKQILKYPNGKILTKALRSGIIEHIRTEPLPQALWKLEVRHKSWQMK